jgi:phenylacetate-CoA ligase
MVRVSPYSLLRSMYWQLTGFQGDRIKRLLRQSRHWDPARLAAFRDERVRALIAHCYENVPYYRRVMQAKQLRPDDIRSITDLAKLPLLTKANIRANADDLLAVNARRKELSWGRTGGTTGEPMRIAKDRLCAAWENMCFERGFEWGGLALETPRIMLFGGSLRIDPTLKTARIGRWFRKDEFIPAFELRSDTAPAIFSMIRRSSARHLHGYSSAIYRLAVLAEALAPDIRFEAVYPTAELLLSEWEEAIRRRFQCQVLPYYGCGEINSLGFSTVDSRYLIPEEQCVIEVMSHDGAATLQGEGQFVLTSLANYAMPLLRYVNGDAGRVAPPSGSFPYRRIDRLDGRFNSFLITDKGELISGVLGTHIFRHVTRSVETYRIIQEEPLRIVIKVVPRDNLFSDGDEQLVRRLFTDHLGRRMTVAIERVASLERPPSGKSVFVFNHLL